MDLFGLGFGEIALVIVLALIIVGPGKIAGAARMLGRAAHSLKKATSDLATQITRETEEEDKKRPS